MPRTDQGITLDRYCVIPRVLIFIFKDDHVLLIKGNPLKRIWPNQYNGIGGHVEHGEDVLSAARRELKEESGIKSIQLWLCGSVIVDAGADRGISLFIFKGVYEGDKIIESSEGTLEWVNINDIDRYALVEDLPVILPIIHKMEPGTRPFFGFYKYGKDEKLCIRFGE